MLLFNYTTMTQIPISKFKQIEGYRSYFCSNMGSYETAATFSL